MPVPLLITAAAAAPGVTSHTGLVCTVGGAIIGLLSSYFWSHSKKKSDGKKDDESKELFAEIEKQAKTRKKAADDLSTSTTEHIHTLAANNAACVKHIKLTTDKLQKEAQAGVQAEIELLDTTVLINQIGNAIDNNAQPLIKELQKRLYDMTLTHKKLSSAHEILKNTVRQLQQTANEHTRIQDKLEENSLKYEAIIRALTQQIEEANRRLTQEETEISPQESEALSNTNHKLVLRVTALEAELEGYVIKLQQASRKILQLREVNASLKLAVDSLSQAPESDNQKAYSQAFFSQFQ